MKKFLLTLLTLFMASSMFAEDNNQNYFTMDNINVVKTKLGTVTVQVPVKAHFDNYVSAWQFDLGYVNEAGETVMNELPEGISKVTSKAGSDLTLDYIGDDGEETTITPNLKKGQNGTRIIVACDEAGYDEDGETYGCVKWAPGDYNQMWIFTFTVVDDDFKGATLVMLTAPSCGGDQRPEVQANLANPDIKVTKTCQMTVEYIAPEPEMTWNANTYTMTLSVPEGYDAHDFVLYANGVEVTLDENNSYTVEQTDEEQKIVFTAYTVHDDTETYDSNDATYGKLTEYEEVTVPAKVVEQTDKPSVTYSNETPGEIMVWAYGVSDEGVEYTLYCDGVEYTGNMPITYDIYEGYNHVWTATAQAPGKTVSDLSEPCTINIAAQQKPLAPEATLVTDEGETQVTVNFTPATGTTVSTVKVGEQTVTLPYAIDRPAYGEDPIEVEFEVTVTGDNYTTNTYTVKVTVQPVSTPPTPVETTTFVKVTKADQLVVGKKYIIVCGNKAMGAAADGNFLAAVAITAGDEVEVGNDVAIMTLGGSLGHYTLAIDGKYLSAANSTGLSIGTSATEWAIADYNGTLAGYRVKHADYNRAVRYSSSYNRFGNYSTTDENSEYAWIYVEKTDEPVLPVFEGTASVVFNENVATLTYTSNDPDATVVVKVDGTEKTVEWTKNEETGEYTATYTVEKSDVPGEYSVTVALTVTPSDNYTGEEVSKSATYTYTILEKTEKPVITYENGENGVVVTATGNGTIILYVKDQQVATGEGTATYTIPYGTDPEEVGVSATAQESGKDVSDYALKDVVVPGVFTATASVVFNENVATLTYTTNDEDATVTVKVDDVETTVEWNNGQATYTVEKSTVPGEHSVTVELTVAPSDLFYGEPVEASDTYTYTVEKPELAGDITIGDVNQENGQFTVEYDGDEDVTLTVTVKDETGKETTLEPDDEGNYTLPAEGTYDITVTATADGYKPMTETAEDVNWTKPVVEVTPTPEITVTRDAEKYTVKATGDGTVTLNIDGKTYDLRGEQSVDLLREDKDYKVTATATAKDGDKLESEAATKDVIVKALVNQPEKPEVTVTPNRNPETNDVMSVDIVIEAPEGTPEDAEIWYSIDGNDPVKYNGEFNYAEDGNHTIEAWVVVKDTDANVEPNSIDVEGKKEQASFEIGIGTNVNELVNGKQIAGVRYFNMAGQEMQEANGITIVVTTYTDGTTSTVKVMK